MISSAMRWFLAAGTAACLLATAARAAEAPSTVQLRGSSSLMTIIQPLAETYMASHPGSRIIVSGGDSWWGVKSVIEGTADIAMTSWKGMPADLTDLAKDSQVTLDHTLLARAAVVPVVNPANPIRDLGLGQLRELFRGGIVNWHAVGGLDLAVVVGSENSRSGTFEVWNQRILGSGAVITPTAKVLQNHELPRFIARNKGAIAYAGQEHVGPGMVPLTVNGIAATPETIHDGRYPILRDLTLIARSDAPASVKAFIAYCDSAEAEAVIWRFDAVPMATGLSAKGSAK